MADTTYTDNTTPFVNAEWLNEVNSLVHTIFGTPSIATQVFDINASGDVSVLDTAGGTALFLDVSTNQLQLGKGLATETVSLELGTERTGDGGCNIDLVGDATYTDYSLRLTRLNAGINAESRLDHRGTGALVLKVRDAGSLILQTNNTTALTVDASQDVGLGIATPDSKLHVWRSTAGAVTAAAETAITIENSINACISFLTGSASIGGLLFGTAADNDAGGVLYDNNANNLSFRVEAVISAQLDDDATAGNTRLLIYDVDNATLGRVSVGAADSGGAGYKLLRILN